MKALFPQSSTRLSAKSRFGLWAALGSAAAAVFWLGLATGSFPIDWHRIPFLLAVPFLPSSVLEWRCLAPVSEAEISVVWQLRLPRLLLGMLLGAALATAGAVLQGLFRNPLADPGLVGVSAGAALGAVLAVVLGAWLALPWLQPWLLPLAALGGGFAAVWLVYRIARVDGRTHLATLLLAGIALNAISGAGVGFLIYLATDEQLRRFTFWTLGSLHNATWLKVGISAFAVLPVLLWLPRHARELNAMLLGETEAWHLGVNVQHLKRVLVLSCALLVGASVAAAGMIGFVGLVVPHVMRLLFGPDHRIVLPASALGGAFLMVLADWAARTLNAPSEIPVGILTALIGAPFFLFLLLRQRRAFSF